MAQHHLAGAWNEIQQGAKQEWGNCPMTASRSLSVTAISS